MTHQEEWANFEKVINDLKLKIKNQNEQIISLSESTEKLSEMLEFYQKIIQ